MYCRLLELAVRKAKHEAIEEPFDVSISLNLESFIPKSYIPEDALKMDIYRRLNRSTTFDEVRNIAEGNNGQVWRYPSTRKKTCFLRAN